jgi:hypothetical protein
MIMPGWRFGGWRAGWVAAGGWRRVGRRHRLLVAAGRQADASHWMAAGRWVAAAQWVAAGWQAATGWWGGRRSLGGRGSVGGRGSAGGCRSVGRGGSAGGRGSVGGAGFARRGWRARGARHPQGCGGRAGRVRDMADALKDPFVTPPSVRKGPFSASRARGSPAAAVDYVFQGEAFALGWGAGLCWLVGVADRDGADRFVLRGDAVQVAERLDVLRHDAEVQGA